MGKTARMLVAVFASVGVGLIGLIAPAGAAADTPFNCDASALRATLLSLPPIEPITANRGATTCQDATGTLLTLPPPLNAKVVAAETSVSGDKSTATAQGGVLSLGVSPVSIPLTIPVQQILSSVAPINIPVPTALQLLGLPAQLTVDIKQAVAALLPNGQLPNVDLVDAAVAYAKATATCSNGSPSLSGTSNVAGLSVLGQTLPIDAAVSQALTLLNSQDIDLSKLDLSKVQLPAGLSFTTPGVGTLLQSVLGPILKSLPPIKIPAQLATVDVVPNEQIVSNGTLTQRALHVTVTLLAQNILDLVLGEARVSNASVNCAGPNQASQLALQCTTRKLTLIDVLQQGNRVKLLGAAQRTLIGKQVAIYFTSTHQQVATATVRPDGFFTATAPLPPMSVRYTNLARYQAVAGGEHSLNLKLHRRMVVSHISAKGGKVTISGQVIRPLASPTAGITIQRRVSCTSLVNVKRIMPDKNGNFSVTIAAPPHTQAAVYRAATFVRKFVTNPKRFPTFTLPQYVEL